MKTIHWTMTLGLGAIAATAGAQPNLLTNGGFESVFATPFGSFPSDWLVESDAFSANTPTRSGAWSLRMSADSAEGGLARQGSPFTPGLTLDVSVADPVRLSVYAQTLSSNTINGTGHRALAELFFFDAMGDVAGQETLVVFDGSLDAAANPEDQWVLAQIDAVAPTGAVAMGVSLVFDFDVQNTGQGAVYWDDASLVIIPAPAAATPLALALFAIRRRR